MSSELEELRWNAFDTYQTYIDKIHDPDLLALCAQDFLSVSVGALVESIERLTHELEGVTVENTKLKDDLEASDRQVKVCSKNFGDRIAQQEATINRLQKEKECLEEEQTGLSKALDWNKKFNKSEKEDQINIVLEENAELKQSKSDRAGP